MPVLEFPYCSMCRRRRIIPGVGPLPNRWLFLGEGGGWEESKYLEPFVGKSGRELNGQYLPISGLSRYDIRIENAMQCFHEDPEQELVDCCAQKFLPDIIDRCKPEVIVTLGAMALAQFGDYSLELEHGFPIHGVRYGDWTGTLFPCYHPAAGLHQSRFMIDIQDDFRNLWAFRHGRLIKPVDQHPKPDYRLLRTRDDFRQIIRQATDVLGPLTYTWKAGTDTEYIGRWVWCQTISFLPGTGYMLMADNQDVVDEFITWARQNNVLWIFHNWLADSDKVRQMGMTWDYRWKDTMVGSYHLGNTPQGLKVLCYRLCGMLMQDYDDLVYPYARADATRWLLEVATNPVESFIEQLPWKQKTASCSGGGKVVDGFPAAMGNGGLPGLNIQPSRYSKHTSCPTYFEEPGTLPCLICGKPKSSGKMERDKGGKQFIWDVAAKIMNDMGEKPKTNPFKRWDAWRNRLPDEMEMVEHLYDPMPKPTIDRAYAADPEGTIWYACRDADGTLRSEPELNRRGKRIEREVRKGAAA